MQLSIGRKNASVGRIRGQVQLTQPVALPAPIGGWNAVDSFTSMPPSDAVEIWNMISNRGGVTVRPGTINKCYQIGDGVTEIRTVMGLNGPTAAENALFAATDQGIYDITSDASNPTLITFYTNWSTTPSALASAGWSSKTGDAGYCSYVNMVNSVDVGGQHYLLVCDEVNGLHILDPAAAKWFEVEQGTGAGEIEGVDPGNLVQVCLWKGRILFTERDSSRLWFLTPGAITGTGSYKPVAIDMGSRFPHGGHLKGCWTWTYDGGSGIDDYLVVISSSGDVLVWEGISPLDTSFKLKGSWYVGDPPVGRRIACEQNGDLLILGSRGVIPISQLVSGGGELEKKYITYKIQQLLRSILRERRDNPGWSLSMHPSYGILILNLPYNTFNARYESLCFSMDTGAWTMFSDIKSLCWESWEGSEYIGTVEGRVLQLTGTTDKQQEYTAPSTYTFTSAPIEWKLLTAFNSFDSPATLKKAHFIRPLFVSQEYAACRVEARYDFNVEIPPGISSYPVVTGPVWDTSEWDEALWGGQYITDQLLYGVSGVGRWLAVALTGRSSAETSLVGFDILGESGGML